MIVHVYANVTEISNETSYGLLAIGTVFVLIAFVGTFGNGLVAVLFAREKSLRKRRFLTLNLAACQCAGSLCGYWMIPIHIFQGTGVNEWSEDGVSCKFHGFLLGFTGFCSICILATISVERCLAIRHPFIVPNFTLRRKCVIILVVYFYCLALTLPPFFGWGKFSPGSASKALPPFFGWGRQADEDQQWSCGVDIFTRTLRNRSYIVFIFVFGFIIPTMAIFISYGIIIYEVRQSEKRSASSGMRKSSGASINSDGYMSVATTARTSQRRPKYDSTPFNRTSAELKLSRSEQRIASPKKVSFHCHIQPKNSITKDFSDHLFRDSERVPLRENSSSETANILPLNKSVEDLLTQGKAKPVETSLLRQNLLLRNSEIPPSRGNRSLQTAKSSPQPQNLFVRENLPLQNAKSLPTSQNLPQQQTLPLYPNSIPSSSTRTSVSHSGSDTPHSGNVTSVSGDPRKSLDIDIFTDYLVTDRSYSLPVLPSSRSYSALVNILQQKQHLLSPPQSSHEKKHSVATEVMLRVRKKFLQTYQRESRAVAAMTFIVIATFILSWLPYATVVLIAQFGPRQVISPQLLSVCLILAKMFVIYNPIVYGWKDRALRARFWKLGLVRSVQTLKVTNRGERSYNVTPVPVTLSRRLDFE